MSTATADQEPGPDEQYCPTCGEIIKQQAEICPECGVRNQKEALTSSPREEEKQSRLGILGYSIISIVSGLLALFLFPPVFGGISVFCGYRVYKRHRELVGIGLMAYGGITLTIGVIIGIATFA